MRLLVDNYLQVRYVNLNNSKVKKDVKIAVIGDMHISNRVSFFKIEKIKKQLLKENADYNVFVGDLIDRPEELQNETSVQKLRDLLTLSAKVAPTFVVLGNHDYIVRGTTYSRLKEVKEFFRQLKGVTLLDNDVYTDDKIWLMGYTETIDYYNKKEYNHKAFFEDFKQNEKLYTNMDKKLTKVALIHSPEFSDSVDNMRLLKDYDLIICGHTHDGCIPFGIGNFHKGIISPKKSFFPKNVRGLRQTSYGYLLITGGIVKISEVASKFFWPFNHLCPMQMDVVKISSQAEGEKNIQKKWY